MKNFRLYSNNNLSKIDIYRLNINSYYLQKHKGTQYDGGNIMRFGCSD